MVKFSANLGFLWTDIPLPAAIHAAKSVGFDAVECHWPYKTPANEIVTALEQTGLTMLVINTVKGEEGGGGWLWPIFSSGAGKGGPLSHKSSHFLCRANWGWSGARYGGQCCGGGGKGGV